MNLGDMLKMIRAAALLLASCLASGLCMAQSTPLKIDNSLDAIGLHMIKAGSSDFDRLALTLLGDDGLEIAQPILPKAVIIRNDTGRYIWGLSVILRFPDTISPSGSPVEYRINPSPGGSAPRNQMIGPGAVVLITAVPDFYAVEDESGHKLLSPELGPGADERIKWFQLHHGAPSERVEAIMDSAIFEDGTIMGPDSQHRMELVNSRISAERDLASSIRDLKSYGLRSRLSDQSKSAEVDEYSRHKVALSNLLLAVMDSEGETGLKRHIDSMQGTPWFSGTGFVRREEK